MGRSMRCEFVFSRVGVVMALLVGMSFACTRPNPGFCCTTEEQCLAAGVDDGLRPCGDGQACATNNTCVAKECDTSADCSSPDRPSCSNGLCISGCEIDDDCNGQVGTPHCDAVEHICVGCVTSDQCPADAAICDPNTRACRGCLADFECTSGVCLEADGICAADDEIIYVSEFGVDTGMCPKDAPCRTLTFARGKMTPERRVIRIVDAAFSLGGTTTFLADAVIVDGADTILSSPGTPGFRVTGSATIEGVVLPPNTTETVRVEAGAKLRAVDASADRSDINVVGGGTLELDRFELTNTAVRCANAALSITRTRVDRSSLNGSGCDLALSRSHLGPGLAASNFELISFQAGLITVENNLIVENHDFVVRFGGIHEPGSTFRFNTIVNPSSVAGDRALECVDTSTEISSNVFAYNSPLPIEGACRSTMRRNLFDLPAASEAMEGVGNVAADVSTFFKDRINADYHLAPNSPAIELGTPDAVDDDFDGNPRPSPIGTNPDTGAFEAP
jgi:hypothetical protein